MNVKQLREALSLLAEDLEVTIIDSEGVHRTVLNVDMHHDREISADVAGLAADWDS